MTAASRTAHGQAVAPAVRLATAAALALVAVLLLCPLARADGDPASDILLQLNVFYPYNPSVSSDLQRTLNRETAAAARAGFPIKVALIQAPTDLGVAPNLFGKPQTYADFLDQEINFITRHDPLLVVMPNGYGVKWLSPSAAAALPKPSGSSSNDLAKAAIIAVQRLAVTAGHPIPLPTIPAGGGSGSSTILSIAVLALAAAVATGTILAVRTRRSRLH